MLTLFWDDTAFVASAYAASERVAPLQEAEPEQQARKRPHAPVPAAKGDHAPVKLQKVESGSGKAELRQPSGCGARLSSAVARLQRCTSDAL